MRVNQSGRPSALPRGLRAATPGRDFPAPTEARRRRGAAPPPIRWARRPLVTGSGRRLLAVRLTAEGVDVLVAKTGAPIWVPADSVLSPERAAEWARSFFFA
ncbi:MAG: hypothetical protein AMXMBFR66_04320 [Pseudomonadota bacterium]|nr:hypothetical protein [Rubrivivax sp.]NLZ40121.1 hypothetical protein [Comamonadaceae bacterium]